MTKTVKKLAIAWLLASLAGCSATTLRCGIHEGGSYVELINVPQEVTRASREYANLCGFAYEKDMAKLNIIDGPE